MSEPFQLKRIDVWQIAVCLVAVLPVIFVLVTWDNDGKLSPVSSAVRFLSLPITFGELIIIILAIRNKFSIESVFRNVGLPVKFFTVFWLLFALSAVFLSGQALPLQLLTTIQFAMHVWFLAAGIHLASSSEGLERDGALSILAIGSLAYIGVLILFALAVPDKLAFPWALRLPTGTNVRQIGYFAAIASVAPAALVFFGRSRALVYAFVMLVSVAFIAWTGSRGALAGLFVGSLAAIVLVGQLPSMARSFLMISSCLVGLAVSTLAPNPSPEFGLVRMTSSLEQEDVGSGRGIVWESTLIEISKQPWLGHGSGSFNQNMRNIYGFDFNHPHQFLLQFTYDWGVLGSISAGLLLLILFWHCLLRARRHKDAAAYASISALCVISAVGMIDGAWFYPFSIFLALSIVICGFVNGSSNSIEQKSL